MKYDINYYENMLLTYAGTAEQISRIRWDWISEVNPKTVLDYGSGVGWFRALRPKGILVDSFDVAYYPQTGISQTKYDVICFFDVLEHMRTFDEIQKILAKATYIAGTVPILRNGQKVKEWKHYKPGEHVRYWSESSFEACLLNEGFQKISHGWPECPPRTDILSFLYKKGENGGSVDSRI